MKLLTAIYHWFWPPKERRPFVVANRLIDNIERDCNRRVGALVVPQLGYTTLLSDMRRHGNPIVRSGSGVLIRGIRVVPDRRLSDEDGGFEFITY